MDGWIRPYRDSYIHDKCGALTKMGRALSETYARIRIFTELRSVLDVEIIFQ
jgi:hypothetical protein